VYDGNDDARCAKGKTNGDQPSMDQAIGSLVI
jgi:hypothetical protein